MTNIEEKYRYWIKTEYLMQNVITPPILPILSKKDREDIKKLIKETNKKKLYEVEERAKEARIQYDKNIAIYNRDRRFKTKLRLANNNIEDLKYLKEQKRKLELGLLSWEEQLKAITMMEGIISIKVENETLYCETCPIVIFYGKMNDTPIEKTYELGRYVIKIDCNSLPKVRRLGHDVHVIHPHITRTYMCTGNFGFFLHELRGAGNFAGILALMVRYLSRYDKKDPLISISYFACSTMAGNPARDAYHGPRCSLSHRTDDNIPNMFKCKDRKCLNAKDERLG